MRCFLLITPFFRYMDRIDALGPRPDRHGAFDRHLLSEAEDEALQAIVEEAARDLSTPIALVNLVLEQIQFFKAHYGLPPDLEAARGTDRDVSFCQFVVRDGQLFEVNDALQDDRVPQYLVKQYGIRAYLGIPVIANDTVVGSLCVIDTEPRQFTDEERRNLEKLAGLVNARLTALSAPKQRSGAISPDEVAGPALDQLRLALGPLPEQVGKGKMAATAISLFLRLTEHGLNGGTLQPGAMEVMLKAAREALNDCKTTFFELESYTDTAARTLATLDRALLRSAPVYLSEIVRAAVELASAGAKRTGGLTLAETGETDPLVATPRTVAVPLIATCIFLLTSRLAERGATGGIRLALHTQEAQAEVVITAGELPNEAFPAIAAEIRRYAGEEATVSVQAIEGALRLLLAVAG